MVPWYINTIFASCGILTYGVCLHYLAKNFDCQKIQNYILCLESVISLLIYIGYLVLSLSNHFLVADSIICGSITFLLYVKEDISLSDPFIHQVRNSNVILKETFELLKGLPFQVQDNQTCHQLASVVVRQ